MPFSDYIDASDARPAVEQEVAASRGRFEQVFGVTESAPGRTRSFENFLSELRRLPVTFKCKMGIPYEVGRTYTPVLEGEGGSVLLLSNNQQLNEYADNACFPAGDPVHSVSSGDEVVFFSDLRTSSGGLNPRLRANLHAAPFVVVSTLEVEFEFVCQSRYYSVTIKADNRVLHRAFFDEHLDPRIMKEWVVYRTLAPTASVNGLVHLPDPLTVHSEILVKQRRDGDAGDADPRSVRRRLSDFLPERFVAGTSVSILEAVTFEY